MATWIQILLVIILATVIVVLISENRHPVRTLAWILLLCLLPVVGLVLYLVFGTDKRRSRLISDDMLSVLKGKVSALYPECILREVPDGHTDLASLLYMTNRAIPLGGNSVGLFTRCDEMFGSLLKDIGSAHDHINFEFFKFEDDAIGRRFGEELIRKASEGVEVRVQYDSAMNLGRRNFYRWLRKNGVKVRAFLPVIVPFVSSNTNYRNHRKVVVIDGRIGYTGGMNIAERYASGIRGGDWRDTHLRIEGPAVAEMQTAFAVDWSFSTKEFLDSDRFYPKVEPCGDSIVQIATSGPFDRWNVTMQGMMRIITQAKRYLFLESPYLIPTEPVLAALRNAALSGVDVRLILPYRGDRGVLVPLATRSYVEDALEAGVKVYFYNGGYLHSKTIVADDTIATVGSTNLDVRSFEQDFEMNAFLYDKNLACSLRDAFLNDQKNSTSVDGKEWHGRPRMEKLKESFARLFSPLL